MCFIINQKITYLEDHITLRRQTMSTFTQPLANHSGLMVISVTATSPVG